MTKLELLITEFCPDGVEFGTLADIGDVCMCKRIFKEETESAGDVPFYKIGTFGKEPDAFISQELFDEYKKKYSFPKVGDILISAAGTIGRTVTYNGEPAYFQDSNIVWIDNDESKLLNKFLYYFYSLQPWAVSTGGTISRLYNDNIRKTVVPLPPLPVQCEIVRILDSLTEHTTELIAELEAELTARKKHYEYYRDKLLAFGDDVSKVALGDIATDMYRGAGIKRDEVSEDGTPCVRYGEIYTTYNIWFKTCVSHTHHGTKTFDHGDILFAITGESVEEIAKSCAYIGHDTCFAGGDIVVMKHNQNPKYVAYALSTADAQAQKSKGKIKSKVVHSSVPALKGITIPLPSLEEQARIVTVLDNFYALTTDISNSLHLEIEARKKQYEYYRDKLLVFKELEA